MGKARQRVGEEYGCGDGRQGRVCICSASGELEGASGESTIEEGKGRCAQVEAGRRTRRTASMGDEEPESKHLPYSSVHRHHLPHLAAFARRSNPVPGSRTAI